MMTQHRPPSYRHSSFRGLIGVSRVDITPPVGIYARNWGAAKHDVAELVHRGLTLTAMVLSTSRHAPLQIYLDADLGWWKTPQTYQRFSSRLRKELGIESQNLIFALSHTHAGPALVDADESLPGSTLLSTWFEDLYQATVQVIQNATEQMVGATLEWNAGSCGLATNRDLIDPDVAANRVVCGFNPGGSVDDTLLVGRVTDDAGKVIATLTNYACHPTTLAWDNRAISPDYVGAMRETIENSTGAPALFMLGACGELAPRYQYVGNVEVADQHGRELGFATLSVLSGMEPPSTELTYSRVIESGAALAVWERASFTPSTELRSSLVEVQLPIKDWPTADELEAQRLACDDRALAERLLRKRNIRRALGDGSTYPLQIFAWRMGDAVLIGSCCEAYSLLQTELRERFPGTSIVCMNLINGSLGYLPPQQLYDQNIYPVWQTPFDRGSLEKTMEAMTQVVQDVLQ